MSQNRNASHCRVLIKQVKLHTVLGNDIQPVGNVFIMFIYTAIENDYIVQITVDIGDVLKGLIHDFLKSGWSVI